MDDDGEIIYISKKKIVIREEETNNIKKSTKADNSLIYIILLMLIFGVFLNIGGLLSTVSAYNTSMNLEMDSVILEDGSIISNSDYFLKYGEYPVTYGEEFLFFEDGQRITIAEYSRMAVLDLFQFGILILLGSTTIFFILTKNKLGIYTFLGLILLALISNIIGGNIAGIGIQLGIGFFVFRYLKNMKDYWNE